MTRCPFSLSRMVKLTKTGQVIYKAEKDACRAFPEPQGDGLNPGPSGTSRSSTRWSSWASSRSTFLQGLAPDPLLRLVLEQVPRHAQEGGPGQGAPRLRDLRPREPRTPRQHADWLRILTRSGFRKPPGVSGEGGRLAALPLLHPLDSPIPPEYVQTCA